MEQNEIRKLLQNVANGDISVDDALLHIKNEPFEDLGYAKPDFHLELSSQMQRYIKINFKRRFPVQAFAWTLI